jgi:hypothetical protein
VSWHARRGWWKAEITKQGQRTYLGLFTDVKAAARAYDAKARELHGAEARVNFPRAGEVHGSRPKPAAAEPAKMFAAKPVAKPAARLYQVFSTTNELGGGAGGAIAGELTKRSMEAIVEALQNHAGFNADSKFLDVGHGTGRPSLHMAVHPGCAVSAGVEYYGEKWQMSITNLHRALAIPELASSMSGVRLFHADAESVLTFEPFTHVYVYCTGFPGSLMHNVVDSFNRSESASCIVLFSGKVSNRKSAFFVGGATLITLARYLVAVAVVRALQNLTSAQRASDYGLNAKHVTTVKCKMSKGEGGAVSAFVYLKGNEPVGAGTIRQQSQWKLQSDYGQRDDKDCRLGNLRPIPLLPPRCTCSLIAICCCRYCSPIR